ncbi:MAG: hypothetical protein DI551_12405 [Micavibrio aeruginosavorus]|uniref:histidine kinase n=1 Tax=Micavibrio aeruginosavorus TaxID=349221 RepID=A0A2W5MPM0_9BACT|nr:MAG: hypothetical protein DI551_12405 [Micavibrio aeruginosavorus]
MKRLHQTLKENLALYGVTFAYILCIVSVVYGVCKLGAPSSWPLMNTSSQEEDYSLFFSVAVAMSALGFLLIVLTYGNILNLKRLHKHTQGLYTDMQQKMLAIEASSDGIAILDAQGQYTYMNKAHAYLYGFGDAGELLGKKWSHLYTQKRITFFMGEVFPSLEKNGRWSGLSFGRKKDGGEFPQEVSLTRLDSGGLICIVRDVSEKAQKDKIMRMIKLAVEAAEDGIAITDAENRVLFMNRSFLKIHGLDPYEREKYIYTDWRDLYNDKGKEHINSHVLPTTILKGIWNGTILVGRKDGSVFHADASLTRLQDGVTIGVIRDVSARIDAEKERADLKEKLFYSQKTEAIGRITNGMVKDFGEITSKIDSILEETIKTMNVSPELLTALVQIETETSKATDIVDQLLAFSSNKEAKDGSINLSKVISNMQNNFSQFLPDNISMVADVKISPALAAVNEDQLNTILESLIRNAVEAMGDSMGKIAVTLRDWDRSLCGLRRKIIIDDNGERVPESATRYVKPKGGQPHMVYAGNLQCEHGYIQLSLQDTGPGIMPEILSNVFDPFFTTKVGRGRAGLGLSTVHGIMMAVSGAVIIETVPGEGAGIHLFFPRWKR